MNIYTKQAADSFCHKLYTTIVLGKFSLWHKRFFDMFFTRKGILCNHVYYMSVVNYACYNMSLVTVKRPICGRCKLQVAGCRLQVAGCRSGFHLNVEGVG